MRELKCLACHERFNVYRVGQYFCHDCRPDDGLTTPQTAEEVLHAGGFTTTPLPDPLSGVAKGTSENPLVTKGTVTVTLEGIL